MTPGDTVRTTPPDIDDEMRKRFDAAEKIRIHETSLARPALAPDANSLRSHFESDFGRTLRELRNPHLEPRVTLAERAKARPASVLLAFVPREHGLTVLLTQRHHGISFPGHWVFPGGRADEADRDPIETALRETEEEIGLDRRHIDVLGRLGDYVSHSGYRVAPVVALVEPPFDLDPQPGEVEAIAEVDLKSLLDPRSYFLFRFQDRPDRAHFAMEAAEALTGRSDEIGLMLTGVTVSIAIGLYGELLKTHT